MHRVPAAHGILLTPRTEGLLRPAGQARKPSPPNAEPTQEAACYADMFKLSWFVEPLAERTFFCRVAGAQSPSLLNGRHLRPGQGSQLPEWVGHSTPHTVGLQGSVPYETCKM